MTLRKSCAAAVMAAAGLAAAAPVEAGPIAGADVAKLFPGQFEAQVKGYRVNFSGSRNGTLVGAAYGQHDNGRWFVRGSALCVSWNKWTKGQTHCGQISQTGGWYVASNSDGELLKFRRTDLAQN